MAVERVNGTSWLRKKGIEQAQALAENAAYRLKREIGTTELLLLFVDSLIGAGIFVLPGVAAAKYAGPAVSLSYLLGGNRLHLCGPLLRRIRFYGSLCR
ncbi:hypothetical protein [Desulfothermobacter acidiphilus]|uniref:hypothetical protein n=1 Tax=Desulfothermobacter acidiphilus TaxID=1938353 RepID=UPI003F8BF23A